MRVAIFTFGILRESRDHPHMQGFFDRDPHVFVAAERSWRACEGFVMLGCIALGLLQLIAIKFDQSVGSAFTCFLRTRRRHCPSERTVKAAMAQALMTDFYGLKPSAMRQEIRDLAPHPPPPRESA